MAILRLVLPLGTISLNSIGQNLQNLCLIKLKIVISNHERYVPSMYIFLGNALKSLFKEYSYSNAIIVKIDAINVS